VRAKKALGPKIILFAGLDLNTIPDRIQDGLLRRREAEQAMFLGA
jgi:hypothetical protein